MRTVGVDRVSTRMLPRRSPKRHLAHLVDKEEEMAVIGIQMRWKKSASALIEGTGMSRADTPSIPSAHIWSKCA